VALVAEDLIDPAEQYHVTVLDSESGATEVSGVVAIKLVDPDA